MSKEYYVLSKEVEGEEVYVSRNAPDAVVSELKDALSFFSLSHIAVWRKCNPNVSGTIATKVLINDAQVSITKVE